MTVYSQNGYTANDQSVIVVIAVPGGRLRVRQGSVAVVFKWLAEQFNSRVEPLQWPGCWGYAERPIQGSVELSNHASGTAVDFNAPDHPLTRRGTFTFDQVIEINLILKEAGGVIRWGGNYHNRADEMHFEIDQPIDVVNNLATLIILAQKKGITLSEAAGINANIDEFERKEDARYQRLEAIHKEDLAANAKLLAAINSLPAAIAAAIKASS